MWKLIKITEEEKEHHWLGSGWPNEGNANLLDVCPQSVSRDVERQLRIQGNLGDDHNKLIFKTCNSFFVIYKSPTINYTIEDLSDYVSKGELQYDFVDISMRTEEITTVTLRFDENSSFNTSLGFTPYWDHQPKNFFNLEHISQKVSK